MRKKVRIKFPQVKISYRRRYRDSKEKPFTVQREIHIFNGVLYFCYNYTILFLRNILWLKFWLMVHLSVLKKCSKISNWKIFFPNRELYRGVFCLFRHKYILICIFRPQFNSINKLERPSGSCPAGSFFRQGNWTRRCVLMLAVFPILIMLPC